MSARLLGSRRLRCFALFVAISIWGLSIPLVKWAFSLSTATGQAELSYLALRFIVGSAAVLSVHIWLRRREHKSGPQRLTHSEDASAPAAVAAGICLAGGFFFQTSYLARPSTTAIDAAFITATTVAWIPIVGLCLNIRPSRLDAVAVLLALLGTLMLSRANVAIAARHWEVIIAAFLFALQVVLTSRYARGKSVAWTSLTLVVPAVIFSVLAIGEYEHWHTLANAKMIFLIMYTGILSTAVAVFLESWALAAQRADGQPVLSPNVAGVISALEPLLAVAFGALLLGESMTLAAIVGGGVIIFANFLEPLAAVFSKGRRST